VLYTQREVVASCRAMMSMLFFYWASKTEGWGRDQDRLVDIQLEELIQRRRPRFLRQVSEVARTKLAVFDGHGGGVQREEETRTRLVIGRPRHNERAR